jgi:transcriptional regulator with XRE-family HTH domain
MEFPEILSNLRKNRFMSVTQLANKLDVSKSTISLWESGQRTPDYKTIIKICQIFEVTSDFLLGLNETTTNTLLLNLISNDKLFFNDKDYFKHFNDTNKVFRLIYNQKKVSTEEIEKYEAQLNNLEKCRNSLNNTLLKNKNIKDELDNEIAELNILINNLKNKRNEQQSNLYKKAHEIDELNNKRRKDMMILYSIQQLLINNHYRSSIVYQVLFLNDLGINLFSNETDVMANNAIMEIEELYEMLQSNISNLNISNDAKNMVNQIKQLLKPLNQVQNKNTDN